MSRQVFTLAGIAGASALLAVAPAAAHHSSASYDRAKPVVLTGQVKELQWTNPHSWIEMEAQGPNGRAVQWLIELEGPKVMVREGWSLHSLLPGDRITARVMPLKDGRPGARLIELTRADGTKLHLFTPRVRGA